MLVISNSSSAHFFKSGCCCTFLLKFQSLFPRFICAYSGNEVPEEDEFVCPVMLQKSQNPDHHKTCL